MDAEKTKLLNYIASHGTGVFPETATDLLSGKLQWQEPEIENFIDSFLNDPYLTRNF